MNYVNAVIANKAEFDRELDTEQPVFVVFISHDCAACTDAMPRFMRISQRYEGQVKVMILDCVETPRHPRVDRIPMLLIYKDQQVKEAVPGLGEQALEEAFKRFARLQIKAPLAATNRPASPSALPPLPPSSATPRAPGYRPQPANDPIDSSPARPGSDNRPSPRP